MKQVIRTIIAYYNGHEFIKEQVDSILNQEGIESFDNQVYIYDDESEKNSLDKLIRFYKDDTRVTIIKNEKNQGPFHTYLFNWVKSINEVDYLFLADQDDYFFPGKYIRHINAHIKSKKSAVISSDAKWFFLENRTVEFYKNAKGHNMSFDMNLISEKYNSKFDNIYKLFNSFENDFITKIYHDSFLLFLFHHYSDIYGLWGKPLALHRVHDNAITNSKNLDGRPYRIWSDQYNMYFLGLRPVFRDLFNEKITISDFNKKYYFSDGVATANQAIAPWIKWKFDNLAMYVRMPILRNSVSKTMYKKKVSKSDWVNSKITHKKYLKKLKQKK